MADIKFRDTAHRDFFLENMMKCRVNDCYHRAFFYVMGIASETRANINQMFNFKEDCIEPEGMHGGWQTSGTVKVCHLAFNLWNGYAEEGRERYFTPEELFCCEFAPYFMEGIKLNSFVFLIEALGLVILQRSKHLATLDVMTVDNQIVTFGNITILLHIRRT